MITAELSGHQFNRHFPLRYRNRVSGDIYGLPLKWKRPRKGAFVNGRMEELYSMIRHNPISLRRERIVYFSIDDVLNGLMRVRYIVCYLNALRPLLGIRAVVPAAPGEKGQQDEEETFSHRNVW